ncbi:hypothetical protein WMY93_021899 [Mugilogobius chulae]|uniref:Uncharacterized protein n=1 Tax=Mugilogobius chulae TaxID=88201 RepID=A0AAW0NN66_9GOBI
MDDGCEMSDGVQAKVPIRGQPEGGVSATGANGRRLEETAALVNAWPRLTQPPLQDKAAFPPGIFSGWRHNRGKNSEAGDELTSCAVLKGEDHLQERLALRLAVRQSSRGEDYDCKTQATP